MQLDTCKRCGKLYTRVHTPICSLCIGEEEADYDRIRNTLAREPGLTVEKVAEKAEVDHGCVVRMLDAGRLENTAVRDYVPCGRCGAPAISKSKRLCEKCLIELDQECAQTMRELREKKPGESVHRDLSVHETVELKRGVAEPPKPARTRQRMVIQEQRERKGKGRRGSS